jgi:hypothetical protein
MDDITLGSGGSMWAQHSYGFAITLFAVPSAASASDAGKLALPVVFWLATPVLLCLGSLSVALFFDWRQRVSERRRRQATVVGGLTERAASAPLEAD